MSYGTDKQVKENQKLFGRRIEQLKVILEDDTFIPNGSTNSYHEFIHSMYVALISGRKITPKMESSITKIVKSYSKTLNPEYKKEKLDYTENTIAKLNMIKRRLDECNYTRNYTSEKLYFLESIEKQVYSRGSLSIKQRKALNKMYTQFTKKIGKNEKFEKKIEKVKKSLDFNENMS
jgi:arginine decarboxylase-like protein